MTERTTYCLKPTPLSISAKNVNFIYLHDRLNIQYFDHRKLPLVSSYQFKLTLHSGFIIKLII